MRIPFSAILNSTARIILDTSLKIIRYGFRFPKAPGFQNISRAHNLLREWFIYFRKTPGGRLNKKDGLTRYGDSHVKDKTS